MERLIKNGNVILDGTLPKYKKEKLAYEKLEEIETIMEKYGIQTTQELDSILSRTRKKINLAKALTKNKCCLGYILQFNNGKCCYQNDNDLGLDLESIDQPIAYKSKIYLYKKYYVYYIVDNIDDDGTGIDLELAKVLLKECHKHFIPLTKEEEQKCKNYWNLF